ncbi:aminoglycoside phosphotransferase family protein [Sedimentibacter sp. zth1]|uniref:aminoglycoside phosphotransferase family protein n=1 Tax=Sedimentibacter sp. zth1 TaxID=2816908 RepID=UPI001A9369CE|nr:aminoglycoside phosphotransferase family protein [Sedimentibacter sp. zth1]QSX06920.1 aminoglycoside phosphotransferase family protein [Sedimentibacter sp. zth1]
MIQPEKWRETINPFSINYKKFILKEILGYPHAGNDVFYVKGIFDNKICNAYIKIERQKGANIVNEANVIKQLSFDFVPKILEYSESNPKYIITEEAIGERLSYLLDIDKEHTSLYYMESYGKALAEFHKLKLNCNDVIHRRFFDIPPHDYMVKWNLITAEAFLLNNSPKNNSKCFVHGDFHYANILWNKNRISCVLDYELSGNGIREFDIAWAIFLRPGQKFLKTKEERDLFLEGYKRLQNFDMFSVNYYLVLIASYFYSMGNQNYRFDVDNIISDIIN